MLKSLSGRSVIFNAPVEWLPVPLDPSHRPGGRPLLYSEEAPNQGPLHRNGAKIATFGESSTGHYVRLSERSLTSDHSPEKSGRLQPGDTDGAVRCLRNSLIVWPLLSLEPITVAKDSLWALRIKRAAKDKKGKA